MIGDVPTKNMVRKVNIHVIQLKKNYMCAKTMVAKVDMIIESLLGYVPSKTKVAKVHIHDIQLKKDYVCAKTMVAKVDMIIKSFDRICTFKNHGGEG